MGQILGVSMGDGEPRRGQVRSSTGRKCCDATMNFAYKINEKGAAGAIRTYTYEWERGHNAKALRDVQEILQSTDVPGQDGSIWGPRR